MASHRSWQWLTDSSHQSPSFPHLREVVGGLSMDRLRPSDIWSTLESWKTQQWMPHELTENPRGALFTLHNNRPIVYWIVTFEDQRISYNNQGWLVMAKHLLQPSLLQTRSRALFGGLLPVSSWATSLHVRSVLNRGDAPKSVPPAAGLSQPHGQFSSTRKPERMSHVEPFKSSMNPNVVSPATFTRVHQPSTISSSILTTFCREHTSTASGLQNRLSESSWKPKAGICMLFG